MYYTNGYFTLKFILGACFLLLDTGSIIIGSIMLAMSYETEYICVGVYAIIHGLYDMFFLFLDILQFVDYICNESANRNADKLMFVLSIIHIMLSFCGFSFIFIYFTFNYEHYYIIYTLFFSSLIFIRMIIKSIRRYWLGGWK